MIETNTPNISLEVTTQESSNSAQLTVEALSVQFEVSRGALTLEQKEKLDSIEMGATKNLPDESFVLAEEGKGLSTNDYTDLDKQRTQFVSIQERLFVSELIECLDSSLP